MNGSDCSTKMYCNGCLGIVLTSALPLNLMEYNIEGRINRLDCTNCRYFIGLSLETNEIIRIDSPLDNNYRESGWKEVSSDKERIVYYILCQITYPEIDAPRKEKSECTFDVADDSDKIIIRWENGIAAGFYTLKPKGTEVFATRERYTMNTVDTIYIRSMYRNRGFASEILLDVTRRFPQDDVGFSKPISMGMWQVLKKFLTQAKERRLHFWEIEHTGFEGSQKLIWFLLKSQKLR